MKGIRVHRVRDLAPDEVTVVDRVPVTTPARTLLDLGECLGMRELEQALARAERSVVATREAVREMVDRHPQHHGARVLRVLVRDDEPAALTRSRAEELLLDLVRLAHLPPPAELVAAGYHVVRFTWQDLTRQREATLARLAQALVHENWEVARSARALR